MSNPKTTEEIEAILSNLPQIEVPNEETDVLAFDPKAMQSCPY